MTPSERSPAPLDGVREGPRRLGESGAGWKVAVATCAALPEPDPDQDLLMAALARAGIEARLLAWDTTEATAGELVVLRSTWNYYEDVDRFLAWIDRTAKTTRLFNPAPVVRENVEKTYLGVLERAGIAIVPTEYVGQRSSVPDLATLAESRGWASVVIKPVVSAGSFSTERFDLAAQAEDGQRFLATLARERDVMIQRWMPTIDTSGERSLVWIDGEISHAIRKSPRFAGGSESVSAEVPIADDERAFAERVLAAIPARSAATDLLYARIDMLRDDEGTMRLMELELIEPSLFFQQAPRALDRFVAGLRARLQ